MEFTSEQAAFLRDTYIEWLENEHKHMLRVIEECPEDKAEYKPHERSQPFNYAAFHSYGAGMWFASIVKGEKVDPSDSPTTPPSIPGLLEACKGIQKEVVDTWNAFTGEQLAAKYDFMGVGENPGVEFLGWHIAHLIHHRGEMQVYLRLMGAKCPAIYGPSADVTWEEMAKEPCE